MQKAISVIMFKLEGQIIQENPEFEHGGPSCCLDKLDLEKGTVTIRRKRLCPCSTAASPPWIPKDPYALSPEEGGGDGAASVRLPEMRKTPAAMYVFCILNGSLYKVYNGNLLYHGCVPLNE